MNAAILAARDALECNAEDPCSREHICDNHGVLAAEQDRLLAGHGLPAGCGGCGGPHRFDTSVPSVLWNRVIRSQGLSEYLCAACIVREFAKAGVSFTATPTKRISGTPQRIAPASWRSRTSSRN